MVLVIVSTFDMPAQLKQNLEARQFRLETITTDTDDQDLAKGISKMISLPGEIVKSITSDENLVIYIKNDGTIDNEMLSSIITSYYSSVIKVLSSSDYLSKFISLSRLKTKPISSKLELLELINDIDNVINSDDEIEYENEEYYDEEVEEEMDDEFEDLYSKIKSLKKGKRMIEFYDNDEESEKDDNEEEIKPKKVYREQEIKSKKKELQSELDEVLEEDDKDYVLEFEEMESEEENVKLFKLILVDENGNPVPNKQVKLSIESDDGVFSKTGSTELTIKTDSKGEAVVKVITVEGDVEVEFSYEIV